MGREGKKGEGRNKINTESHAGDVFESQKTFDSIAILAVVTWCRNAIK